AAPNCAGSDSHTALSLSAGTAVFICGENDASAAAYWPASSWSSRRVASVVGASVADAVAETIIAAAASHACIRFISGFLLEQQGRRGIAGHGMHHVDQLPALPAVLVQFLLQRLHLEAAEHTGVHFDDEVLPLLVHGSSLGSVFGLGRRPALRSASRSTYSICALRLRRSSSAQRCAAASTSALMRSG